VTKEEQLKKLEEDIENTLSLALQSCKLKAYITAAALCRRAVDYMVSHTMIKGTD
jgi:hypothetical protein